MTYDKVTPESAADGDVSDSGFIDANGWEISLSDALEGADFWQSGTVRELVDILRGFGGVEDNGGGSFYESDARVNYTTGEETRRALHIEDVSARNRARLRSALRSRKVLR